MKCSLKIALIFMLILLAAAGGFTAWAALPAPPSTDALAAAQSTGGVLVENRGGWQVFRPAERSPVAGLVFYPGARVDYRAYAPLMRMLARQGYLAVVPSMPLNLAFFGINRASDVMAAFPEINRWAVGGHSLGGAMAASYARSHLDKISGLVLWAAYPAGSDDLSTASIKVVSIYASQDGLATPEKIDASRALLPADTRWVSIAGGNHAQFGSYGVQAGDGAAQISPQAQWDQVVSATASLLSELE